MVDISYDRYRKLRRVSRTAGFISKRPERTRESWESMPEKQRQSIIAGLIQDAHKLHGEGWECLIDGDPELSYEAAHVAHDASGRGGFLTFITESQWYGMDEVERCALMNRWRTDALLLRQADTPETEVVPW
jgi:predicted Fe-S protein YdhL (DUF1289 family)